ncbi:hypothetical protein YTPLAS18_28580 [Nitrospira sp.]|nr:hypothetical protein YTPLAS18_28580 [Nitrospira sp.]
MTSTPSSWTGCTSVGVMGVVRRAVLALMWLAVPIHAVVLGADSHLVIPKPTDALLPPPPVPALEPSVVNLTISATLRQIQEAVESSIPLHHAHEDDWIPGKVLIGGAPFEYKSYIWRGPVRFRTERNRLITEFHDVRYRVQARLTDPEGKTRIGACGYGAEWPRHLRLEASSEIQWSDDWVIRTVTRFGKPELAEPCRLHPAGVDVTTLILHRLNDRLPALAAAIDRAFLQQGEAKKRAEIIWETLQEPVELRSGTWLTYGPTNPQAGALVLDPDRTVRTTVTMGLQPAIVVGPKPTAAPSPLPPLQTSTTVAEGFHLTVPMTLPYSELNTRLADDIVGEEIIPPVGSRIKITGVQLYGSEDKLISEVNVSGGVNGNLYLQGKPEFAADGHTLEFTHFDFTVDTKNVLVGTTSRLMHDTIRQKVLPDTQLDLQDRIEGLRKRMEKSMNRELAPGIWLQGTVDELKPIGIYPVPSGVEIQFLVHGSLLVILQ